MEGLPVDGREVNLRLSPFVSLSLKATLLVVNVHVCDGSK